MPIGCDWWINRINRRYARSPMQAKLILGTAWLFGFTLIGYGWEENQFVMHFVQFADKEDR